MGRPLSGRGRHGSVLNSIMQFTIRDLLRLMITVAFLAACIAGEWRGDRHTALGAAMLVGRVGIAAAVVVGLGVLLWLEKQKVIAVSQERDEATANWHDASKTWVEATSRIPKNPFHGVITEGAPPAN
jgi:hypothetical protein